jgi:hypothetical protein
MLGDIGHPQLVRFAPGEVAIDQVKGHLVGFGAAPFRSAGGAGQPGAAHQQLDGAVANDDSATQPQLGVHSARAVGPAGVLVDLDDEIGQPGMADRPRRRRPAVPGVVARG